MIKNKTARKILFTIMSFGIFLTLNVHLSSAATLFVPNIALTDATPSASSTYDFNFRQATAATLTEIDLRFATTASSGAGTRPAGTLLTAASLNFVKVGGTTSTGWTLGTIDQPNGVLKVINSGAAVTAQAIEVNISGITNSALTDCPSAVTNSDTCYIRIADFTGTQVASDSGVGTYTVSSDTQATATIDPSLTLTISGVTNGVAELNAPTVNTTGASTATTLPFGNLTTTAAYMAQTLSVATNANSGYQVTMAMTTPMTGTNPTNTIQPMGGSTTWAAPTVWAAPTGTIANTNTAWLGANTSDTRVHFAGAGYAGWTGPSNNFAPVNPTPHIVDFSQGPDNGTSVSVTYELQANVSQPADTYTGVLKYNAVGTY